MEHTAGRSGDKLAGLARGMAAAGDEVDRAVLAVQMAVELVAGCDHAGVMVVDKRAFTTRAATDSIVERGDQLQYELDEGPCLDAVRDQETVVSLDVRDDPRWPRWSPAVHSELGVNSMMSLLLYTDRTAYGALNLYGDRRRAFDSADLAAARTIASHLAVSMAAGREIEHLGLAIANRTIIGQAEGILMERFGLTGDQAFAYLRRMSQESSTKLVQVAAELVNTREVSE